MQETVIRGKMDERQFVLSIAGFLRDPVIWALTVISTLFGLATPETLSSFHGLWMGLLALLGGFLGKALQTWLQFRQQRAKEHEDQAARFERILEAQRKEYQLELDRYYRRIEQLEAKLDQKQRDRAGQG